MSPGISGGAVTRVRSGPQARAADAIGGQTLTLPDGTVHTGPDAATCPPGQDATDIEKDINIDAAARAGLIQMTSKGNFHGDSIAVDARWKKFPAPVNITMNVELTQGPGGDYQRVTSVSPHTPAAGIKTVTVTVSWQSSAYTHAVTLPTLFAQ